MKRPARILFLIMLAASFLFTACSGRLLNRNYSKMSESRLFGKSLSRKVVISLTGGGKESRAKRKGEINTGKKLKAMADVSRLTTQRTLEIQTAEVRARMKQDQINTLLREEARMKARKEASKKEKAKYSKWLTFKDKYL